MNYYFLLFSNTHTRARVHTHAHINSRWNIWIALDNGQVPGCKCNKSFMIKREMFRSKVSMFASDMTDAKGSDVNASKLMKPF